jgi:thiamine-phosphate pyrophosphorylase
VHLGGESVPVREVVRWCRSGNAPAGFLVGVSCHDLDQARDAESAGASYVFFGPVFDSPAKRAFGPPQGVARLAEACRAVRIPVIAIGGVNEENGADCIRAGAAGIAAIRLFQEPREPAALKEAVARMHELVA